MSEESVTQKRPQLKEDRFLKSRFTVSSSQCAVCEKVFQSKKDLRRHLLTHTGAKLFSCAQCSAKFRREQQLREHEARGHGRLYHRVREHGVWSFECGVRGCAKKFGSEAEARDHGASQHSAHVCTACNRTFDSRAGLKFHVDSQHERKTFGCTLCTREYTQRSSLNFHMKKKHAVPAARNAAADI